MNFVHLHNSRPRNRDHHILLIVTGNTLKESCPNLSLIQMLAREEGLKHNQTDCSGDMVVAFTITEINYLVVSLFFDVVLPFSYLYLWY